MLFQRRNFDGRSMRGVVGVVLQRSVKWIGSVHFIQSGFRAISLSVGISIVVVIETAFEKIPFSKHDFST